MTATAITINEGEQAMNTIHHTDSSIEPTTATDTTDAGLCPDAVKAASGLAPRPGNRPARRSAPLKMTTWLPVFSWLSPVTM